MVQHSVIYAPYTYYGHGKKGKKMRYAEAMSEIAQQNNAGKVITITVSGLVYDKRRAVGVTRHPLGMIWDVYANVEQNQNGEQLLSVRCDDWLPPAKPCKGGPR